MCETKTAISLCFSSSGPDFTLNHPHPPLPLILWSCYICPAARCLPTGQTLRCPRWQGSPALTGWYRCQEPSGQMAGAKGEQTTRVRFFSRLLVGWAVRCGTKHDKPPPLVTLSLPHPLVPWKLIDWGRITKHTDQTLKESNGCF